MRSTQVTRKHKRNILRNKVGNAQLFFFWPMFAKYGAGVLMQVDAQIREVLKQERFEALRKEQRKISLLKHKEKFNRKELMANAERHAYGIKIGHTHYRDYIQRLQPKRSKKRKDLDNRKPLMKFINKLFGNKKY